MKKLLLAIIMLGFFGVLSTSVKAMPVFFSWGGEQIIKVADFPDTEEFEYRKGEYVDAGYVYKQVSIFFIPVWNYDGRWVGYLGKESYLIIEKSQLDELAAEADVKLPDPPALSFWQRIGGKIVFSLILLLYLGLKFSPNSVEDVEETATGES